MKILTWVTAKRNECFVKNNKLKKKFKKNQSALLFG